MKIRFTLGEFTDASLDSHAVRDSFRQKINIRPVKELVTFFDVIRNLL